MAGRGTRLDAALKGVLGVILLAIFVLNLSQVAGRYLVGMGAVWIPDLTRLLFIWLVFLGTALMHRQRRHLVIDYLLLAMPRRLRRAAEGASQHGHQRRIVAERDRGGARMLRPRPFRGARGMRDIAQRVEDRLRPAARAEGPR
jgi:hypothetical protein